ncbi:MAG: beta/alpha barrel domain-containing protein [Rhodospirillaceae bacterium]
MSDLVIRDVTLRDGLQSIPEVLSTADKLALFDKLIAAGVHSFQITSFVNPARVPQTADAEAMYTASTARPADLNVLIANLRGFERAVAVGARSIDAVVSASDSYNRKNSARGNEESAREIEDIIARAKNLGFTVGVDLANCFHCFIEGEIPAAKVTALVKRFQAAGVERVWLSDTTGHATPEGVTALVEQCRDIGAPLGLHLHDTLGRAGENALAGYRAGVRHFDAALNGIGGSPFTPGVGGNLSLETVTAVFSGAGIDPGFTADKLGAAREALKNGIAAGAKS